MDRSEKGVSPLIATLSLLLLVVMAFAVYVYAYLRSPAPTPPITCFLEVRQVGGGIEVEHLGGDAVPKAFKLYNGAVTWLNLVVKLNGENLSVTGGARVGGLTTGMVDFGPGARLELPVSVGKGDTVTVIYVPAQQTLRTWRPS